MTSEPIDFTLLIPDYLNDMLDEKSRVAFEAAVKKDPALKEELEEFKEVRELYQEAIPASTKVSEPIFTRVINSIEAGGKNESSRFEEISYRPSLATRLSEFVTGIGKSITIPWTLALVQAAVIVLLVVARTPENRFNTLGTSPLVPADSERIIVNVVFSDSVTEAQIRGLLLKIDGTIIDGPSVQGRYRIRIEEEQASNQTLAELQQSELIRFAEKAQ